MKQTKISYQDMPFISALTQRDDLEMIFIGYLYDSLLLSKYCLDYGNPDLDELALYQGHMTVLKSYLTSDEYLAMIKYLNTLE